MSLLDLFRNILGLSDRPALGLLGDKHGEFQDYEKTNKGINEEYGGRQENINIFSATFGKLFEQEMKELLQILKDPSMFELADEPSSTHIDPYTKSPRDEVLKPEYDDSSTEMDMGLSEQYIEEGLDLFFGHFNNTLKLFEQQIQDRFKQFHIFEYPSAFGITEDPANLPIEEPPSMSPRNDVLKPGFQSIDGPNSKKDIDLDEQVSKYGIESLLRDKTEPKIDTKMRSHFSGQSVIRTFTKHPNGGVEHEEVVRDSAGNEHRTITRSLGDQSYSVVTTTSKEGVRTTETLKNIDEDKLEDFKNKWDTGKQRGLLNRPKIGLIPDDFPFNKFF